MPNNKLNKDAAHSAARRQRHEVARPFSSNADVEVHECSSGFYTPTECSSGLYTPTECSSGLYTPTECSSGLYTPTALEAKLESALESAGEYSPVFGDDSELIQ